MAEKLFMNSEEKFKDFCNNANDLMQSVTPEARFRWVNNTWLKSLGYKKEEIADMTVFDIIHPDELEHCQELFMRVMSGEDIGIFTTVFVTKDGNKIFVEGDVSTEFVAGKPIYTRAIFRDISKRKWVQEKLRESSEKWLSLVENTDDTIIISDNNNVIQYINRTIPPTTPEGVIGNTIYEYVSEEHHKLMNKSLERVYKTGEPDSYEVTLDMSRINPEMSNLWFRTKLVPIKSGKEITGVIMIATDITERKQLEEQRERLIQELQEALDNVKTLSGLLPICAWCKKIRDDEGYWKDVEQYISEHTKVELTHSICPKCFNKTLC